MSGDDMSHRLAALIQAIENTLVTAAGLQHDLQMHHERIGVPAPPFQISVGDAGEDEQRRGAMAEALRAYGGVPGPLFNLWCHLAALDRLRTAWVGR
jgi:hypothetical protein